MGQTLRKCICLRAIPQCVSVITASSVPKPCITFRRKHDNVTTTVSLVGDVFDVLGARQAKIESSSALIKHRCMKSKL